MRPRSRQRNLVVWSSSADLAGRRGARAWTRTTRIRRRIRTCALLALIGLIRLARVRRLLLAGAVLTLAGVALPSAMAVIAGTLILLRGVAVTLGVSEPRREADFFGFGTRPRP